MTHPIESVGNVLPQPGFYVGGSTTDDEILYSTVGFTQKGVTLAPNQGILPAGTVLGRITASKLYTVYKTGNSDGSQVARGILRTAVNTNIAYQDAVVGYQANIVIAGIIRNSKLSGADSGAITTLAARVDTVLDTFHF